MAATDQRLGELHALLTEHFMEILSGKVEDEDGNVVMVPAAVIGTIVAFLKNNNITADPTTNKAVAGLTAMLERKATRRLDRKSLQEAADAFGAANGDGMLN